MNYNANLYDLSSERWRRATYLLPPGGHTHSIAMTNDRHGEFHFYGSKENCVFCQELNIVNHIKDFTKICLQASDPALFWLAVQKQRHFLQCLLPHTTQHQPLCGLPHTFHG